MDANKCRTLLCVIEKGNISEAAEGLGYTPSGVSRMISSMEEETGFPLLKRGRTGASATTACESLIPAMKDIIRADDNFAQTVSGLSGGIIGSVRAGTAYDAYFKPLADVMRRFRKIYPGITMSISQGPSSLLMEEVGAGSLDFCVISRREGECEWIPLFDDPMTVWVPADHPAGEKYPLEDLEKDPYIMVYPDTESDTGLVFEREGITPDVRYTTSDIMAAFAMVEAGLGVTLVNGLSENRLRGDVRSLPTDPLLSFEIGIAVAREADRSPAAKLFRDLAVPLLRGYPAPGRGRA